MLTFKVLYELRTRGSCNPQSPFAVRTYRTYIAIRQSTLNWIVSIPITSNICAFYIDRWPRSRRKIKRPTESVGPGTAFNFNFNLKINKFAIIGSDFAMTWRRRCWLDTHARARFTSSWQMNVFRFPFIFSFIFSPTKICETGPRARSLTH